MITTALTYVASTNAIVHAGATPVFADLQPTTGNVEPTDVEPGFGCAMGDVHVAIALAQLLVLDAENARRREITQHYRCRLGSVAGLRLTDVLIDCETNDHPLSCSRKRVMG